MQMHKYCDKYQRLLEESENHSRTDWCKKILCSVLKSKRGSKPSWLILLSHVKVSFLCCCEQIATKNVLSSQFFGQLCLAQPAVTLWCETAGLRWVCVVWARASIEVRFSQDWTQSCYFKGSGHFCRQRFVDASGDELRQDGGRGFKDKCRYWAKSSKWCSWDQIQWPEDPSCDLSKGWNGCGSNSWGCHL